MSETTETEKPDDELLPDDYDRLVPVEDLRHGEHNPRRVRPKDELRKSIEQHGIDRPLIVRTAEDEGVYHITDGWQRYQAATGLGWECLPVRVYETALEALEATETQSIVREWSTFEWAQYCASVASEVDAESTYALSTEIANRTVKSQRTVRRYLEVLDLPEEVHPLLVEGPSGSPQDWAALQNYHSTVKRYDGLSWHVAYEIARRQDEMGRDRVLGIAAKAVTFDKRDDAIEFVDAAVEEAEKPLETIRKEVLFGQQHERYLEVPRTAVKVSEDEKRAVMDYCRENRRALTEIVQNTVEDIAAEAVETES